MDTGLHEVVISGIAGNFPDCRNVSEFKEKLFSKKVLLVNDVRRWNPAEYDKPFVTGKVPDEEVDRFDGTFFGVHPKLARNSDPILGTVLERSTEAIFDAGVNPFSLKGQEVCVIVASSLSDAEMLRYIDAQYLDGNAFVGLARTMFANRLSYIFNFTGPSYNLDSSWASAVQGLEIASTLVAQGAAQSAIVSCCNLTFHNSIEQEYMDMDFLSTDSEMCNPFDAKAKGFIRSEGTVSIFIQRKEDAKRNYGTLIKCQARCLGSRDCSYVMINPILESFFKNFYKDCKIDPRDVSYLEAFGFCKEEIDAHELNAIANVFCERKKSSLMIGSSSGNIGNSEVCSSLVSLIKVIIALQEEAIPPTINYHNPNPRVPALISKKITPVTETTGLPGDLVAINNLSFSGNVGHVLLRKHDKTKRALTARELPEDGLPRLVILQARNEEGAARILEKLSSMPVDVDFVSMVNDVFKVPIPPYICRAYTILPVQENKTVQNIQINTGAKRPVWFVFSGMGSQWPGMGKDLMRIPVFAKAIEKCAQVLHLRGVDLKHTLTSEDPAIFQNILNSFIGIASIQIGLTDVLHSLGITPDGILGHSTGELGCAYADGCLTAEETILSAYFRGRSSIEANYDEIKGTMAAIGLGYNNIKDKLPDGVDVACHNSVDSCTLSGPTDTVLEFVDQLKKDGIFARPVSAGGIAYHSRYIGPVGTRLFKYMKELIPHPKPRSSKWMSTSVPQAEWQSPVAQYCSAEYITNNAVKPVLFEEACQNLPKNAILIEIAPHGLMQAILRRSVNKETTTLSLTNRTAESNLQHLLNSVGKLHLNNVDMDVNALYPLVQYPVGRGTPSLAEIVTWDHSDLRNTEFRDVIKGLLKEGLSEKVVKISRDSSDYELWKDHRIDGEVVIPFTQFLMYPWTMIFGSKKLDFDQKSVVIEDIASVKDITVAEHETRLLVSFTPNTLQFEVSLHSVNNLNVETNVSFLKGHLHEENISTIKVPQQTDVSEMDRVSEEDIYSLFEKFGLQLENKFKEIKQILVGTLECFAQVGWTGNIVSFLHNLFQVVMFVHMAQEQQLLQPSVVKKLTVITPLLTKLTPGTVLDVHYDLRTRTLVCEGVELVDLSLTPYSHRKQTTLRWRETRFQPLQDTKCSVEEFLSSTLQLVVGRGLSSWMDKLSNFKTVVVKERSKNSKSLYLLENIIRSRPHIFSNLVEVDLNMVNGHFTSPENQNILVIGDFKTLLTLLDFVKIQSSIFCLTYLKKEGTHTNGHCLKPVLTYKGSQGRLALFKKVAAQNPLKVLELKDEYWQTELMKRMEDLNNTQTMLVYTYNLSPRQVLPILSGEPFAARVRSFFIQDSAAPKFSTNSSFYASQISLGLSVNILSGGLWGSLCSFSVDITPTRRCVHSTIKSSDSSLVLNSIGLNTTTFTVSSKPIKKTEVKYVDYCGHQGGRRVMGVAHLDLVSNYLTPDSTLVWPVPSDWSMEDAATVPVTYALAYYCVCLRSNVKKREKLLVHAGLSPVGQAVISIALQYGAEVYTSVETYEDIAKITELFPKLNSSHVLVVDSSYVHIKVWNLTKGKDMDVIINCLTGRGLLSTIKLMNYNSRFVHLGSISIEEQEKLGMFTFSKNTAFFGVSLENIANCSVESKIQLREVLQQGLQEGFVRPLQKRVFPMSNQADAHSNLISKSSKEKTILAVQQGDLHSKHSQLPNISAGHQVIIAGPSPDLWLDVAEWVITQGIRQLIIFTKDRKLFGSNLRKFNKLIDVFKSVIDLYSFALLDSNEDSTKFFQRLLVKGPVTSIICVAMDESSKAMRTLDTVSRELFPELEQFVSVLGERAGVCEARAAKGLPVCSIQSNSLVKSPGQILPYLSTILSDTSSNSRFLILGDSVNLVRKKDSTVLMEDVRQHLPQSVAELEALGLRVDHTQFTEVSTLSPRHQYVKYQLLPVFLVPGLCSERLQPLIQHLMHPAFCPSVPPCLPSVHDSADYLLKQLVKIQHQGPYNLVADSWSSAVVLKLGTLLEASGQEVSLFLLDTAPVISQAWVRLFCHSSGEFLPAKLLSALLNLNPSMEKQISDLSCWEDQLKLALQYVQSGQVLHSSDSVNRALTSLKMHLKAIVDFKPQECLFRGNVVLIKTTETTDDNFFGLTQCCQQKPTTYVVQEDSLEDMLKNPKTAAIVNENLRFSWKL